MARKAVFITRNYLDGRTGVQVRQRVRGVSVASRQIFGDVFNAFERATVAPRAWVNIRASAIDLAVLDPLRGGILLAANGHQACSMVKPKGSYSSKAVGCSSKGS